MGSVPHSHITVHIHPATAATSRLAFAIPVPVPFTLPTRLAGAGRTARWLPVGPGTLQKSINVHETVNFADAISAQFIVHPQNTIKKERRGEWMGEQTRKTSRNWKAKVHNNKLAADACPGPQMPIPGAKININMLGTWPWSHPAPLDPSNPPLLAPPLSRNRTIYVHFVCRRLNRQG